MKKMICKYPVVYNGRYYNTGDTFDVLEEHVCELLSRCEALNADETCDENDVTESQKGKKPATKRRSK